MITVNLTEFKYCTNDDSLYVQSTGTNTDTNKAVFLKMVFFTSGDKLVLQQTIKSIRKRKTMVPGELYPVSYFRTYTKDKLPKSHTTVWKIMSIAFKIYFENYLPAEIINKL